MKAPNTSKSLVSAEVPVGDPNELSLMDELLMAIKLAKQDEQSCELVTRSLPLLKKMLKNLRYESFPVKEGGVVLKFPKAKIWIHE
jgi:hypothetical protein